MKRTASVTSHGGFPSFRVEYSWEGEGGREGEEGSTLGERMVALLAPEHSVSVHNRIPKSA